MRTRKLHLPAYDIRGQGVADGPWAVREMVRKNVKYGVDLIKFCATGGVFSKGSTLGRANEGRSCLQG